MRETFTINGTMVTRETYVRNFNTVQRLGGELTYFHERWNANGGYEFERTYNTAYGEFTFTHTVLEESERRAA